MSPRATIGRASRLRRRRQRRRAGGGGREGRRRRISTSRSQSWPPLRLGEGRTCALGETMSRSSRRRRRRGGARTSWQTLKSSPAPNDPGATMCREPLVARGRGCRRDRENVSVTLSLFIHSYGCQNQWPRYQATGRHANSGARHRRRSGVHEEARRSTRLLSLGPSADLGRRGPRVEQRVVANLHTPPDKAVADAECRPSANRDVIGGRPNARVRVVVRTMDVESGQR